MELTPHARCSRHFTFQREGDVNAKRKATASAATQTDKMSKANEFGSCPDMYRSLNIAELKELLQNDDKMEQIIGLDEKVMPFFYNLKSMFCFVFLAHRFFIASRSWSMFGLFHGSSLACVATGRVSIKLHICAANIEVRDKNAQGR